MKKINLGCGMIYKEGWINVDIRKKFNPDILWDLNKFPYPKELHNFDYCLCEGIIEHLEDYLEVFKELYKRANPGAIIEINKTPHDSSIDNVRDPEHNRHAFTLHKFVYHLDYKAIEKDPHRQLQGKNNFKFKIIEKEIIFPPHYKMFSKLFNKFWRAYEVNLRDIIKPKWIKIKFKVIK